MSLLPLFIWCDETQIAVAIRSSRYLFPAIEVVHLLGLTILWGAVLLVDLRLLGLGMRRQSVSRLAAQITPFMSFAIGLMLLTGTLLFVSEALKCYGNSAFWFKMSCLLVAIVFQYTIHRRFVLSDHHSTIASRATACCSIALWVGVALGGRAIAFV